MTIISKTILGMLTMLISVSVFAGSITVSASSEAEIVPDTAKIELQIRSVEKRTNFARDNVSRTLDRLSFAIRPFGVSAANIEKSKIKQGDEYGYTNGKRVLNGQYASMNLTINVDKLNQLQKIYDKIATYDEVTLIRTDFEIANQQAQEDTQLVIALEKAKHKAQIMANAYKQQLGRAIKIVEVNSQIMPFAQARMMTMEAQSDEQPGYESVKVNVQVQVEFDLN